MELIIDRNKWIRGEGDSFLFRSKDRKMCCLGFYLNQCKIPKTKLNYKATPLCVTIGTEIPGEAEWLISPAYNDNSNDASNLMYINDSERTKPQAKEKKIAKIFKKHNVNVKFIN